MLFYSYFIETKCRGMLIVKYVVKTYMISIKYKHKKTLRSI